METMATVAAEVRGTLVVGVAGDQAFHLVVVEVEDHH